MHVQPQAQGQRRGRAKGQPQQDESDPGMNPFTPHERDVAKSLWRWNHVSAAAYGDDSRGASHSQATKYLTMGRKMTANHWKSLVEPATLPLTTNFLPKRAELRNPDVR